MDWGPPALLTDSLEADPVVALAAPRPDFDGALQEFLIGLLTAALRPADDDAWEARWHAPPAPAELQAALDALPPAFDLDGDGPRVFQDLSAADVAQGKAWTIEALLIGMPGTEIADQQPPVNTTLFQKPATIRRLGRPAAAMALLTLQTYSPEGGRGHRTSVRGGGPLTTIVDPRVDERGDPRSHEQPLWRKLWANVETEEQWRERAPQALPETLAGAFPWLAPTRVSDASHRRPTTPADVHTLQAYFGLPRRIRLQFDGPGRCDMTGMEESETVVGFNMRAYGTHYQRWVHPLSPYYYDRKDGEWRPEHGRAGGIGWKDWLNLTVGAPKGATYRPANAVAAFNRRALQIGIGGHRVHAFGYKTESAKAVDWTESQLPAFVTVDEPHTLRIVDAASRMTNGAQTVAQSLREAVGRALFRSTESVRGDLSVVDREFWAATAAPFFDAIESVASVDASADRVDDAIVRFARMLEAPAVQIFDRWSATADAGPETARRIVAARFNLVMTLRGYSKLGEKLFEQTFRIPAPGGGRAARATKARSRKEVTP